MSFFPFDNEDDDDDQDYNGNIEELVADYENRTKDKYSASELLFIFRFYSLQDLGNEEEAEVSRIKHVLVEGISQFPYMSVFAIHMAEVCITEKNFRVARQYIQEALAYNPMDSLLKLFQAILYSIEGKKNKAHSLIEEVLSKLVNETEILEEMMEVLMFHKQIDLAKPVFELCLEQNVAVEHILETFYQLNGDQESMEKFLPMAEAIVDKDPYNAESWFMLGGIFNELKNSVKAEWAFDYSCTISEQFFEARAGYLEAIYQNEKYSEFIEKFAQAEQQFGESLMAPMRGLYAWSHYEVGEVDKARRLYRGVLKNYPKDNESWYSLGLTYHYDQKYSQAIPLLENAYRIAPSEPDYGVVLAAALFGTKEHDKANVLYDKLSNQFPENEEIWLDWNTCVYETGSPDEALMILEAGIKNVPHSVSLMYRMGAMAYLVRQKETGLFIISNALQINPEEHVQMFKFAPELKKSTAILKLIAEFTNPKL